MGRQKQELIVGDFGRDARIGSNAGLFWQEAEVNAEAPVRLERVEVSVFRIPTDLPEADGTLSWDSTTMVLVEARAEERCGLGYTYADESVGALISTKLATVILGMDCMNIPAAYVAMVRSIRNLGRPGLASCAISAVDIALWDLKAKLLQVPLVTLLGEAQSEIAVYGSGGFTSYSLAQLAQQFEGWAAEGIQHFKMKIGSHPEKDLERVKVARETIGKDHALFVDANGAYHPKQAMAHAASFQEYDVTWFEEPVSSDDLVGMRLVRENSPVEMEIAAGEYGYDPYYFRRMLASRAVDVLQADATRCGGITGFMQAAGLAESFHTPFSAHTAPAVHLHPCCALPNVRHLEYFHDHVRIEQMLFEGTRQTRSGALRPDLTRAGLGLEFKRAAAEKFEVR